MKKLLSFIVLCGLLGFTYLYREKIIIFLFDAFGTAEKEFVIKEKNDYYLNYDISYLKEINNSKIKSKEDLINLYYTIINSGVDNFSFYCSSEYKECINDVEFLADEVSTLSNINSFVHPYNRFTSLKTEYFILSLA